MTYRRVAVMLGRTGGELRQGQRVKAGSGCTMMVDNDKAAQLGSQGYPGGKKLIFTL